MKTDDSAQNLVNERYRDISTIDLLNFAVEQRSEFMKSYCRLIAPVGNAKRPVLRIVVTSYSNAVPQIRQT